MFTPERFNLKNKASRTFCKYFFGKTSISILKITKLTTKIRYNNKKCNTFVHKQSQNFPTIGKADSNFCSIIFLEVNERMQRTWPSSQ